MFASITSLTYWKSEHDERTCEDAHEEAVSQGLFAVADGAGTTLFSNIWSRTLTHTFLLAPLLTNDPFEFEWWVRQAQSAYRQVAPETEHMTWNAQQKAQSQGSHSTLATVRITSVEAERVHGVQLVCGDSCIFVGKANTDQLHSFPPYTPSDFEQAPICIPSKLALFNRYFHHCIAEPIELEANDVFVLTTDAVAKWIISAGGGRYAHPREAFQVVVAQTHDTWEAFILECRTRKEMIADDCTALIVTLSTLPTPQSVQIGTTNEHSSKVRQSRREQFIQATKARNQELLAIIYGDGQDLQREGIVLPTEQIHYARSVADALRDTLHVLRREANNPDRGAMLTPVWRQYASLLCNEPCAETLRRTLINLGVPVASSCMEEQQGKDTIYDAPTTILSQKEVMVQQSQQEIARQQEPSASVNVQEEL